MALGSNLALAQIASVVGLHGLAFLAIAIFATPATLWRPDGERRVAKPRRSPRSWSSRRSPGSAFSGLSAPASETVPGVRLRLIQPNISQGASFAPENKDAIVRRYLELSDRDGGLDRHGERFTHLVWPESAFPFILSRDPQALGDIASLLDPNAILITGAATVETTVGPRADISQFHRDRRSRRSLARALRQASPRAVRRVPSVPVDSGQDRRDRVRSDAGRVHRRNWPTRAACARSAAGHAADLLRGHFSGRDRRRLFPRQALRMAAERHGRRLVRDNARPLSALRPGAAEGDRAGAAARARRPIPEYRRLSTDWAASSPSTPLGVETVLDAPLPRALPPTWQSRFGSATAAAIGLGFLALAALGWKRREGL